VSTLKLRSKLNRKVLLITNIPTPYRVPLFNVMSQMFSRVGFTLNVVFCAKGYKGRKWENPLRSADFEYYILKSLKIRLREDYIFLPLNLLSLLLRERPSVVISGGFSFQTIIVYLFDLITKTPYIVWSGEIPREKRNIPFPRCIIRKILAKKASAFIAYGTKAGEYLMTLDSKKPIFYGWNTVDTEFFSNRVANLKKERDKILKDLEITKSRIHILAVGYLIKRKGFENFLKSLVLIKKNFFLHIIGDGPERVNLENLSQELNLKDNLHLWGYRQKEELPRFFAIADSFVFPSLFDIWGLVPIEAMATGLPVIVSKFAGSTCDLIQHGINGFVIDPYNIKDMAEKIQILIDNPTLRKKMGRNAQKTIQERFTLKKSAYGFFQAIKYGMKKAKVYPVR